MLLKALICGCLVFGLATSAPQRGRIDVGPANADVNLGRLFGSRNRQNENSNQYDGGNNQNDGENNQYDSGNNQYNSRSNQYNSGSNQYDSSGNNQIDGDNQYDTSNNQYNTGNRQSSNNAGLSGRQYDDSRYARIIQYDSDNDGTGNYAYKVSQSDGIYEDRVGEFRDQGNDEEDETRVYGHYGYPGPDGKFYYTEYVADKNGFRPAGDHIPRAASVGRVGQLGIPSAAIASLAGGGLG